ncbi:MAG: glycosyl hydrolase-like 10 protein, partial [Eubacterium sp.]|nr:glycosyl hydrolase-like 10 protein [Eubacterium sp.]
MCKKILALFLCVLMVVGVMTPISYAESQDISVFAESGSTVKVSAVNRPVQAADELILFTRDNTAQLTDSNVWCAAAIADYKDGKYVLTEIKDRAGAVKIPYNGFVLFGHGSSETWILDNLKIGEEVKINGYTLPQVITGQLVSAENGAQHAIASVDKEHENNKLTIYTINYGKNTGVFGTDTEEAVIANNIVAEKNTDGGTGTYIPENGYVISGSGSAKEFVHNLQVGEKVTLINLEVQTLPPMYFKINGSIYAINKKNTERGTGEVILYETSYGATTRTNPWGMEITAENGKVTGVTTISSKDGVYLDNNSPIPQKGYVLSIQADSPCFAKLNGNVKAGDSIELSDSNTFLYNAGKLAYDSLNPKSREDNPAGWDEASNSGFPGFRGADQLIVYDGTYGSTTGTNPWGYEVTVNKDNRIVKAGGNNSQIPQDGYVLSGHGVKADWLKNYALIGSNVIMDKTNKTVLVLFNPESMIDRAVIKIDSVKEELNASGTKFLDVPYAKVQEYIDNAELLVQSAREQLKDKNYIKLTEITGRIEQNSDKAHFANYQSKSVETRAVWIRPKETGLKQVSEHLDKLKELNINTVYLETWWGGYTIFPTENKITEQNPMYNGFDVLSAYLSEAHKRGMEVHSWVENFFIGDSGTNNGGPVYAKKPEWLLISRKGDNFQFVDMYNIKYYFANPALPEARDFIMSIYSELVKKYDIDGLQLDYVRYPDGGDGSNDFGYDTYTRELFKKATGADPIAVKPGDPLWDSWCAFRANIINTFVYRVVSEARAIKPHIKISADVWPNYEAGPTSLMQEPVKWVTKGYIDNIIPMSYTLDISST